MKYRYGIPLLLGILACLCPLQIYADDTLVIDDYINDHANIVDENTEENLNKLGYQLEQETGAQVVFITEDTLHDQDIRQVAYQTFKKYQLGDKDKDNGILFIVSIEDKLRYMEVGRSLEDVITDIKSQHLQTDYLVPYFQKEDYSTGIKE
ncbi:MAG: TPM domain-containing protein, partial [Faecalicoccus sp.]|uniref:TPM domain-containing protein n=1 Tax=Faecalicoccus sp. TaxID=1971758 RepID=UPI002F92BCB0